MILKVFNRLSKRQANHWWGAWLSMWNQGIGAPKIWNLGIEAQKIWNLGNEKISGIWDTRGIGKVFSDRIIFFSSYMGQNYPNINLFYKWTHKQRQEAQDPCHKWFSIIIMLQAMHTHFRAAIRFQKVFSNGLKLNPMELCDYVTHWIIIFISDPSLAHLDLTICFSLYLIKVVCLKPDPPPPPEQVFVLYLKAIIIVNCFHVLSMKYQHYVHIHALDSCIWGSIKCLFVYK